MLKTTRIWLVGLAGSIVLSLAASSHAAFLFEIDTDGLDDGVITFNPNFSFGGDTTTASQSVPSLAVGTSGADSIFGGDGVSQTDTYLYAYAPDSEADNFLVGAGTDLGDGNTASGLAGEGAGRYSVYATWPLTSNVSGGLTTYNVSTAGDSFSVQIDQNGGSQFGDVWVELGEIEYLSGNIQVEQVAGTNSFVSMRSYGLLFERVATVPEASAGSLVALGLATLALARRRRVDSPSRVGGRSG